MLAPRWSDHAGPPVLVKVCGLTSPADARLAVAAGADWLGLNFHPPSPRCISPETAAAIVGSLDDPSRAVGLFVDRPAAEVSAIAARAGLLTVQLHGDEPPEDYLALAHLALVRAYRLGGPAQVDAMLADLDRARILGRVPDAVLIDAHVPGMQGGTGRSIAADVLSLLPSLPRLILAGGLTPANVSERVTAVRPWMVDTASGVESAPGRKAPDLMARFVRAARTGWAAG